MKVANCPAPALPDLGAKSLQDSNFLLHIGTKSGVLLFLFGV